MKKTLTLGVFSILLILGLIVYNLYQQKEATLREAHNNLVGLATSISLDQKRAFAGLEQIFFGLENYMASHENDRHVDPPEIRRIIDDLIIQNDYLTALLIIDADGQVLHWNNNFQKPNLGQRHYFHYHQNNQTNRLFFSGPQQSLVNPGQRIFGVSRAVRNNDQSLSLVIAAIIDLAFFDRQYQAILDVPGTTLTISSTDGLVYSQLPANDEIIGVKLPEYAASFRLQESGTLPLNVTRKVAHYPLLITVDQKESTVLIGWHFNVLFFSLFGLLLALIIGIMTWRITLHQRHEQQIKHQLREQAHTDPLTGLANRRYALEQAKLETKKALRNKSFLTVILLDMDFFKKINDTYGHQSGDMVLEGTAEILRNCCRATDILCRYGGEEFLLVLPDTNVHGALITAQKIRAQMEETTYQQDDKKIHVTASIGVTQWEPDEDDISEALQRADKALYKIKRSGRNNVCWLPRNPSQDGPGQSIVWLHQASK